MSRDLIIPANDLISAPTRPHISVANKIFTEYTAVSLFLSVYAMSKCTFTHHDCDENPWSGVRVKLKGVGPAVETGNARASPTDPKQSGAERVGYVRAHT